jgi:hypothetical protein
VSAKKRIYLVDGKRLIKAYGPQGARNFAAQELKVELASQETLVQLIGQGVKVEATDQPEQQSFPDCCAPPGGAPDPPPPDVLRFREPD